jgi:hypothetical protein
MAVTVTCDKCGEVVAQDVKVLTLWGWRNSMPTGADKHQLCGVCFAAFRAWLAEGGAAERQAEDEEGVF